MDDGCLGRYRHIRDGAVLLRIPEMDYAPPNLSGRVKQFDVVPDSLPYQA